MNDYQTLLILFSCTFLIAVYFQSSSHLLSLSLFLTKINLQLWNTKGTRRHLFNLFFQENNIFHVITMQYLSISGERLSFSRRFVSIFNRIRQKNEWIKWLNSTQRILYNSNTGKVINLSTCISVTSFSSRHYCGYYFLIVIEISTLLT